MELKPAVIAASPSTMLRTPRNDALSVPNTNVIASAAKQSHTLHPDDQWIKNELKETIKKVTNYLEKYQLHLATETLYDFIWHKFADVYLEKSKSRRLAAQPVLEEVFITSLKLLHPFMPFTTEELWQKMTSQDDSLMISSWPKVI